MESIEENNMLTSRNHFDLYEIQEYVRSGRFPPQEENSNFRGTSKRFSIENGQFLTLYKRKKIVILE